MFNYDDQLFDSYDLETYSYNTIVKETDKAWLIDIDGEKNWFPKSQCELDIKRKTITMPLWLAEEKEIG